MYGPQIEYSSLESHDAKQENFLVLGPWRHGYWASSSRRLGNLEFGQPVGKGFRAQFEAKFFAHYLKDEPGTNPSGFDLEDTASFQTGSNTWRRYSHFPPRDSRPANLYLEGAGILSWTSSTAEAQAATSAIHLTRFRIGIGPFKPRIPTDRSGSTGLRKISDL